MRGLVFLMGRKRETRAGLSRIKPTGARTPEGSAFYGRILPVVILAMGIITVALILIAAGVLVGLVPFH